MRLKIIRIVILGLFVLIVLALFYVQVVRGRYFYNLSMNNRIRVVPLEGIRGRILDRNGVLLAGNRISFDVMVTPQDIKNDQELFSFLGEVVGREPQEIFQRFRQKKFTPFAPVAVIEDIDRRKAIVIEENKYRFPSLFVQENYKRFYPQKKDAAHALGYVGKISRAKIEKLQEYGFSPQSVIGYTGAEEYYDTYLKGEQGGLQIEVNSRGRQVRLLSFRKPKQGQDIILSLDSRIQQLSQDLMEDKKGAIVVMDMDTGEILGLTSAPSFDPNFLVGKRFRTKASALFSHPGSPMLNRAIQGAYPPGSVFKVPVGIAALESHKIYSDTSFLCQGYYEIGGIKFGCAHVHGSQNFIEALVHSCNVYFYNLGMKLGADTIERYAKMFGLGRLTHIDLPYEKDGLIPSRRDRLLSRIKRWYTGDTLNFSIGQGDTLTTPLQLVRMMATVGQEGLEVQPHVIKRIGDANIEKYAFRKDLKIDHKIFQTIKNGLRASVADFSGTAHVLNLEEIRVVGKTGTAQTSGQKEDHAWFVGYSKGENKNIAFCVFLEHGGSSQNACLVARQLLLGMQEKKIL